MAWEQRNLNLRLQAIAAGFSNIAWLAQTFEGRFTVAVPALKTVVASVTENQRLPVASNENAHAPANI